MAEPTFLLYSTSSCYLCEQAEMVLTTLELSTPVVLDIVDISDDEALVQRYGKRIPVLVHQAQEGDENSEEAELEWPFTAAQARAFLTSRS